MITRPSLGAWVGMLASLVFVGALSLTPLFSSHDRPPGAAVSFWWARLAPFSYAVHALRTTPVVTIVDDSLYCPDPESLLQSWRTIAANPRADSIFRRLFADRSPATRIYALLGLLYINSPTAAPAVALSRRDTSHVRVLVWSNAGLRGETASVGELAIAELPRVWVRRLRGSAPQKCAV